jgi:phage shock protein E
MIELLKRLFGMSETPDLKQFVADGAPILDVRTKEEYATGHVQGSLNVPLQSLNAANIVKLDKNKPVITCCASGMRSASAKRILEAQGFTKVYNGGGWSSVKNKLS